MSMKDAETIETPESTRMLEVAPFSQKIGEFIEWLNQQGIYFARHHSHENCDRVDGYFECGMRKDELEIVTEGMEKMLARFFEIDLNKVENERRALLEAISK